jgi:hypothetical protein
MQRMSHVHVQQAEPTMSRMFAPFPGRLREKRSAPVSALEQSLPAEKIVRIPHGGMSDAELFGQFAVGRQRIPGPQPALPDQALYVRCDFLMSSHVCLSCAVDRTLLGKQSKLQAFFLGMRSVGSVGRIHKLLVGVSATGRAETS